MNSIVQKRGRVGFPAFTGERVYMREFTKREGLPDDLKRWQPTVDAMLDGIESDRPMFLMIDQSEVRAGSAQRRPGVHIDGYWRWGAHRSEDGHYPNPPSAPPPNPPDEPAPKPTPGAWERSTYEWPEGLLLASNVRGCQAFAGAFRGVPHDGGDCAHIDTGAMERVVMHPNTVYAGNVTMLHESVPVERDCRRTLVRINVPGWTPETVPC